MGVSAPLIENFLVGPLQMRCSVVTDSTTGDTVIIDGGDEPQRLIDWIESCTGTGPHWSTHTLEETKNIERKVVALLNTHAHFDHSGHIPTLKQHFDVEWYLHPDDTFLQTLAKKAAVRYGISLPEPAVADHDIVDDQILSLGSIDFEILHTLVTHLVVVAFDSLSKMMQIICSLAIHCLQDRLVEPIWKIRAETSTFYRTAFEQNCGHSNPKPSSIQDMDHSQPLDMRKQPTRS